MAKVIKYHVCTHANHATEEQAQTEDVLFPVTMDWNETNEEIAKQEAYNGEYTIEDDGQPEPVKEPTADELIDIMLGVTSYE